MAKSGTGGLGMKHIFMSKRLVDVLDRGFKGGDAATELHE